ncbi:glycosyltransferase family 2 protein [Roseomonas eburnea]|uniref:Glycosyltransferase family 2 protein n=1 Tax=Neoroseomonas eburnea TaxID=1346889 RepID=A0A9X9XEW7_9PROT|nr:glycosyltransferase family 2 protein [Neoroseomonas eburnea]
MSASAPRFSVLMPTHNRADVLGFAIASVLAQTEADFELLVVADGCTDTTREVVASFVDSRIRFFDLPKAPHFGYANRNIALREARGRLIAFAAHDDLMLPDHLALMGDLLDRSGAAWGYSRPLWVSTDGIAVPFCTNLALADELREFLDRGNTIPAGCIVHTRDALEQAGYWPEDVPAAADWVLWRRMIGSGSGIAHHRWPTCLHFSAVWKQSRFSASEEVRRLVLMAEEAAWWPSVLRFTVASETEQAAAWRAVRAGGLPWAEAARAATDTVLDRLAWTSVRRTLPELEAARLAQAGAEQARGAAEAERDQARGAAEAEREQARAAVLAAQAEAAAASSQAAATLAALEADAEAARAMIAALRAEADGARREAAAARAESAAMRASTSWRVTAPLRAAKQAVAGRFRPGPQVPG